MIPTTENIKKLQNKKLEIHKKISNTFIENAIANSNISVLKILYYLAMILKKNDGISREKKYKTYTLDLRDMLKYTELKANDIRNNIKKMQQTSITFIDEKNNIESGISLMPEYNFLWNKNKVTIDLNMKIAKLIIEVTDKYTFINTKELMKLKNKHSIRLLPLLHKINGYDNKQKTLTMSELNSFFGVKHERLLELERSILKKIKDELENNCKLSFNYEINYDNVGKGRPRATSVTIKPILKNNYQTNIFSNLEYKETKTQDIKNDWFPDSKTIEKIENQFGIIENDLVEKVKEFKKYCIENEKNYKNMNTSLVRYIKIGFQNNWS